MRVIDNDKIQELINSISSNDNLKEKFLKLLIDTLELRENEYHPLVFVNGSPKLGKDVFIGFFSEINAKGGEVIIGDKCDIASFVSINIADSHSRTIGLSNEIARGKIILENNVFVGSHSFIGGNVKIGHNSVVAAGTILINGGEIPPYSLIKGNPAKVYKKYYLKEG
ncbi:DapH/DapD/GlmU-related protein [Clostridium paridis]|uniref:Acyltransferase n=1 Tax=Clostridium paridis TaxID=2803863 RepID=A0A937FJL0_9CLOT|nr:acyltransferase [Clostridium paridis]